MLDKGGEHWLGLEGRLACHIFLDTTLLPTHPQLNVHHFLAGYLSPLALGVYVILRERERVFIYNSAFLVNTVFHYYEMYFRTLSLQHIENTHCCSAQKNIGLVTN